MSVLIQSVRIKNFRSLKDTGEILLAPVTLLVGANNSGKTTFLRALNLAFGSERRTVNQDDLFIDKTGKKTEGNAITIDIKIVPTDDITSERIAQFDDDWNAEFGKFIQQDETGMAWFAFRFQYVFITGKDEAKPFWYTINNWANPEIDEEGDRLPYGILKSICLYFIDAQRDILEDLRNRTSYFGKLSTQIQYDQDILEQLETELSILNADAVEKSDVLKHLKVRLEDLSHAMHGGANKVDITPLPRKVRDLHKNLKIHFQDGDSEVFGLEYHGMGTRSWASLLTFKAFVSWEDERQSPFFSMLALEEPEAHLHPNAQRQIYRQLKEIKGQKFISTHSPYIVGQAELEEIRHFRKNSDETAITSLDLNGLGLDEIRKIRREITHSRGEILFSKIIVLSEGETEEQALPIFAKKYWGKEAFEMGVYFTGCGGSNYSAFLRVLNSYGIRWMLFSDYDNDSIRNDVNKVLSEAGFPDSTSCEFATLLGTGFEKYLLLEGYGNEMRQAIVRHSEPFRSEQHKIARSTEILAWPDGNLEFETYLKNWKTKLSPLYAEIVSNLPDDRCIPPKIRALFEAIDAQLKPATKQDDRDRD